MIMNSGKRQQIELVFTLLLLLLFSSWQAEAKGEGQKILLSRGSLLQDDFKERDQTKSIGLLERQECRNNICPEADEVDYNRYIALIKRLSIDVVAPGRSLSNFMNAVSTSFLSGLMANHGKKFVETGSDAISRPMLEAYLSVQLSSDEDIIRLSKRRGLRNISGACESLLEKRNQKLEEQLGDRNSPERLELSRLVEQLKEREPGQHHLALLVFKNNLNLFLLESFLALCNRAKFIEEVREALASYESLV